MKQNSDVEVEVDEAAAAALRVPLALRTLEKGWEGELRRRQAIGGTESMGEWPNFSSATLPKNSRGSSQPRTHDRVVLGSNLGRTQVYAHRGVVSSLGK